MWYHRELEKMASHRARDVLPMFYFLQSFSCTMDVLQAKSNFLGYSTQQYNLINICKSKSPWWCHCLINIPLTTRYNPALASVPRQQVQTIIIIATGLLGLFWPARTLIHKLNQKGESMWLCINSKVASWISFVTLGGGKFQQTQWRVMSEGSHDNYTHLSAPQRKHYYCQLAVYTWMAYSLHHHAFWFLCWGTSPAKNSY